jgi:cytochrome c biogenesis protein CcmG, thiol:disulfide interchange protein DsbE
MARRLRLLAGVLALVVAIAAVAVFGLASKPVTGRLAPALPREALVGSPVTLTSLLAHAGGRATLVVFWASWCTTCAQEAAAVERFYRSPAGRGRLVGVDWSDPLTSAARSFVRRYRWSFPILRDAEGTVGNDYRLSGLPNTFVLDAHGRIRAVLRGPQSVGSLQAALARVEDS